MSGLGYSEEEARFHEQKFHEGKAIVAGKPGNRWEQATEVIRRHGGYDIQRFRESPIETKGVLSQP